MQYTYSTSVRSHESNDNVLCIKVPEREQRCVLHNRYYELYHYHTSIRKFHTIALHWLANWLAVVLLPLLCIVTAQLPQQYTWVFIEEYQAVVSCVMWGLTSLLLPPGSTLESHLHTTGQAVEVTLADRVHDSQHA